jgi:8-oxo-dGTP pyrophosphatase MutT (NUDIX family)
MSAKFIVAVFLVIEHSGAVPLVRRSPSKDHAPGEWESVSGRVDTGEAPATAAQREALEETGLSVKVLEPLDTFHFYRGAAREEAIGIALRFVCAPFIGELSAGHHATEWYRPTAVADDIDIKHPVNG